MDGYMKGSSYPVVRLAGAGILILCALTVSMCAKEPASYDDLAENGKVESRVRKTYRKFFSAIETIAGWQPADVDTTFIYSAARLTDDVIADLDPYPTTVASRLSLDALSYAAVEIAASPAFDNIDVELYWRTGLLEPIFMMAFSHIKSKYLNESTHIQLTKALQRGIAGKANDDILLDLITVIGPAPSDRIMEICAEDTVALKKVYDLIVYSRSLQQFGPPVWMSTGPWFMAVAFEDTPLSFYCLRPYILEKGLFLTFRDYLPGTVYESLYNDPAPTAADQMDAWLERAATALDTLQFDEDMARRIMSCDLPVFDTHTFYNEYILSATADTTSREFNVIIRRDEINLSAFEYSGMDSLTVKFTQREIISPADILTPLRATRFLGASVSGGRAIPPKTLEGYAFILPMGEHDPEIYRRLQEQLLPEITVTAN